MSFYSGLDFYICLFISLIPAVYLGLREKNMKWYRILLSFVFVLLIYSGKGKQIFFLLGYTLYSAFLVIAFLSLRKSHEKKSILFYLFIILSIVPLIYSKWSALFSANQFGFLGLSYICFRVLQIIIEIYDGVITQIDIPDFLLFLLFFPTLSSGPIDRSRRFDEDNNQILTKEEYADRMYRGVFNILKGLVYKFVLSGYFNNLLFSVFADRYKPIYIIGYAYVYGFYMFFDFAGYSSLAIGTAQILGICTPENFNMPFISTDMKDFWNRWHITLSRWFRDFVFTRIMMLFVKKKVFKNRLNRMTAAFILNMTIMGIWHGLELHYILYGVYHGILLAATEYYQRKSSFHKNNNKKLWYKTASWFITLNLVMFGFLIFSGHIQEIWHAVFAAS